MYDVLFYFFLISMDLHVPVVNCIIMHIRLQKHVIHLYERIECQNIH